MSDHHSLSLNCISHNLSSHVSQDDNVITKQHYLLPQPPHLMPPLLRLKALQPPIQRLIKEVPARLPKRNRRPEIIAMLRILQHIPKDLVLILLLSALGRLGEGLRVGSPGLGRQRGERAPGVEFTAGPVQLRGADVPAAEDGVGAVGLRPFGEEGRFGGGELAVADVVLVLERVVL